MPSAAQLQLGGPFFLAALIIANAIRKSSVGSEGVEPPRVQSVASFVWYNGNANGRSPKSRKRTALAAVHIAATFFIASGIRAPAGVCPDRPGPPLTKMPAWLGQLAALNATEALQRLAEHAQSVPARVWVRVEAEFNSAVKSARVGLTLLEPGELARSYAGLFPTNAREEVSSVSCEVIEKDFAEVCAAAFAFGIASCSS
jgi:hypothetical protein